MGADLPPNRSPSTDELLTEARQGSREALGQMLESCRTYLLLVANEELNLNLRAKLGPSDVVQETFATAQQAFERFQGQTLEDLLAWLRRILLNKIAEARRRFVRARSRAVARESQLGEAQGDAGAISKAQTPHGTLVALETAEEVAMAIATLSPDHRQVIELRNWQMLSFDEIGIQMGRSAGAARALWVRALEKLTEALDASHE